MIFSYILAIFVAIAVIDKITGNHLKLGSEFEKGLSMACPLILSMSGMVVLAPVISKGLIFAFSGAVNALGLDLSVVSTFFPVDSGGALIAYELSDNILIRGYNGIIVASMFGATICPVLPMAFTIIDKKYHEDVQLGFLCGFATIPVGCFASGLLLRIPFGEILKNSVHIIVVSVLICVGILKKPKLVEKIVAVIGWALNIVMLVGLALGIFEKLTGIKPIPGMAPIDDAFLIIGDILIILSGIFPLLFVVTKLCKGLFSKLGNLMRINFHAVTGLVTTLANCIPMFGLMEKMDKKGRVMNIAFAVSAGFALGDHLAYTLSYDKAFAWIMVAGKVLGGIAAIILVNIVFRTRNPHGNSL